MARALYRKYRSKSLADIVGQGHITDILQRALKVDKIAHAYLFTGPRGVGKTSIARILAHEINHLPYTDDEQHLDIIEIDAASNNGVDDVRLLREKVQIAPVSAAKKIYIIDEVHMLSKPAFNALLKTLEEPPEHVVFILATTDIDKVPATIISRTQRYSFRAISTEDIAQQLAYIAKEEAITIDDAALQLIAERGEGSFRDSISMLDQLSSLADEKEGITVALVETSLGLAPATLVRGVLAAVEGHDVRQLAALLAQAEVDGLSAGVLCAQLTRQVRDEAVERPSALVLLDALLEVPKSSSPYMKLLSVLGMAAMAEPEQRPKNAPLLAPVMEVSATIAELETIEELSRQATKKRPSMGRPASEQAPAEPAKAGETKAEAPTLPEATAEVLPEMAAEAPTGSFTWEALLEQARQSSVALYSILTKCSHQLDNQTLTIYTVNGFYKKKMDDPKYHTHLYEALKAAGGYQLTVHTIPTGAPMKDSKTAAIAAMMGGGIEVSL